MVLGDMRPSGLVSDMTANMTMHLERWSGLSMVHIEIACMHFAAASTHQRQRQRVPSPKQTGPPMSTPQPSASGAPTGLHT